MSKYLITVARSARKELEALDGKLVNRIFPKIENLSIEPRPAGRSKKKASEEVNKRQLYLFDCESIRDKA